MDDSIKRKFWIFFLTLSIFSRGLRAVFIEEVKEEGLAKIKCP